MTVSVIIPVKNGEEYLPELLSALEPEGADEVLVIDSGSTDGSVEIARRFGATVL
jgi:glycosyltransferase involved in cell wall biosynthesis